MTNSVTLYLLKSMKRMMIMGDDISSNAQVAAAAYDDDDDDGELLQLKASVNQVTAWWGCSCN